MSLSGRFPAAGGPPSGGYAGASLAGAPATGAHGTVAGGPLSQAAASMSLPAVDPATPPSQAMLSSQEIPTSQGAPSSGPDPLIGQVLDNRYLVEAAIGEGGMGVVYRGTHRLIERKVALKVLKAEYAKDKEIVERFILEAKTASGIGNPHIIDILDFGVLPNGCTYFAMEFLEGKSLMDVVMEGKLAPERVVNIGLQVCEGLSGAHARDIVHRDLKPDNIFLLPRGGQDFVKILDFGIAKVERDSTKTKLTRAGAVFGTPHYMSPEQAAGAAVDHRADIYALGVILYEMASGQLPFDSDNMMGILTQHMYKAPVPVRALVGNSDCPPGLEAIIQKCLEKRPAERYQSVDELAADLKRLREGTMPLAVGELMNRSGRVAVPVDYFKPAGVVIAAPPPPESKSRLPLVLGVLALLMLVGLGVAALFVMRAQPEKQAAAATSTSQPAAAAPVETSVSPEPKPVAAAVSAAPRAPASATSAAPSAQPIASAQAASTQPTDASRASFAAAARPTATPPATSPARVSSPPPTQKPSAAPSTGPKKPRPPIVDDLYGKPQK
ncbi:MAG: protein kinase [Polyangiaceae bacterium]